MRRFLRPLRGRPSAARWGRRRIPSLAALLFVVVVLLVFNLSNWRYLRWLRDTMREDLIDRLGSVASTTALALSSPSPPEILERSASEEDPESEGEAFDLFAGSAEYRALVERLLAVQRSTRLSRVVLMTPSGTVIADSVERRQPGDSYEFLELDDEEMRQAAQGGPVATRLYRIDGIPFLRLYAPVRSGGRLLALVQVSVSPEYQGKVDRMQSLVLRQWAVSSLLLLLLGLSLWRLFRYLVRVEESAMQGARIDAMGALAGNVAHELRNPLQIIRAMSEEIATQTDRSSIAAANAKDIVEEVDRLNEMVTNFLSLSRPPGEEDGRIIEVRQEVERVLGLLSKGQPSQIVFRSDLAPHPVHVRADERALRQVLLNLLLNAREAIEEHSEALEGRRGEVRISVREKRGMAEIRVADNGPGFDRKSAGRAFEPFFTTKTMGTGLGLAISRGIVENLGGRITLLNSPGEGAEVMVTLPVAAGEAPAAGQAAPSRETP